MKTFCFRKDSFGKSIICLPQVPLLPFSSSGKFSLRNLKYVRILKKSAFEVSGEVKLRTPPLETTGSVLGTWDMY